MSRPSTSSLAAVDDEEKFRAYEADKEKEQFWSNVGNRLNPPGFSRSLLKELRKNLQFYVLQRINTDTRHHLMINIMSKVTVHNPN
jgi:hypothetical protein